MPESKRLFLVCRSKNCSESKRSGVRCTISMMHSEAVYDKQIAEDLTKRRFCTLYQTELLLSISNTPKWQVSEEKPGRKNLLQRQKQQNVDLFAENTDFLEIL